MVRVNPTSIPYVNFNIQNDQESRFVGAARGGNLSEIESMLKDPTINPAENNNKAIQVACANDHIDVVARLLLDDRVDPTACKHEAFKLAKQNGHVRVIELLNDYYANKQITYNE